MVIYIMFVLPMKLTNFAYTITGLIISLPFLLFMIGVHKWVVKNKNY